MLFDWFNTHILIQPHGFGNSIFPTPIVQIPFHTFFGDHSSGNSLHAEIMQTAGPLSNTSSPSNLAIEIFSQN